MIGTQATDFVVSLLKLEPKVSILPGIVSFSNDTFITAATGSVGLLDQPIPSNPPLVILPLLLEFGAWLRREVGNQVFTFCDEGFGYDTGQVTDTGT